MCVACLPCLRGVGSMSRCTQTHQTGRFTARKEAERASPSDGVLNQLWTYVVSFVTSVSYSVILSRSMTNHRRRKQGGGAGGACAP